MATHRINIWRHDRLLGHFESSTPWSEAAARDIASRLSGDDGYRLEFLLARDERRLLDSGPGGLRVVSREPLYEPITLKD